MTLRPTTDTGHADEPGNWTRGFASPDALVVLAATLAVGLGPVWGTTEHAAPFFASALALTGLLTIATLARARIGRTVAGFGLLATVLTFVAPAGTWPLPPLIALLLMAIVSRDRAKWFNPGRPDHWDWAATVAISLAAPAALVTWLLTTGTPSAGVLAVAEFLRAQPAWLLPLIGLGFAVFNAFAEEAIYRGLLQSALARTVGSWPSVLGQGAVFGLAHIGGFPSGVAGVVLAGFYGVALGMLQQRSGGLLAPWAAHVVADLAIFSMVVVYVL